MSVVADLHHRIFSPKEGNLHDYIGEYEKRGEEGESCIGFDLKEPSKFSKRRVSSSIRNMNREK